MATILVVDDDHIVLKVVRNMLAKAGHMVMTAGDGRQAMELLELEPVHLIVSDANMPGGVSGFNLVQMLRNDPKHSAIPFVLLTGRRDKSDVMKAIHFGADDYVVKPVKQEVLLKKIETILEKTKAKKDAG